MAKRLIGKKKILAIAAVACVCVACIGAPAYAFYYVHDDAHTEEASQGAWEICCTLDETAVGGGVHTELIFVPAGSKADAVLDEMIVGNEDHSTVEIIHYHGVQTLREYLQGLNYTCTVYAAASQKPGTQTTYDTSGIGDINTDLSRYDNVVFRVQS